MTQHIQHPGPDVPELEDDQDVAPRPEEAVAAAARDEQPVDPG